MAADHLLEFVIVMGYFGLWGWLLWLAGKLLYIITLWAADAIERRQERAEKQVKAVPYGKGHERKAAVRVKRCVRKHHLFP